MFYHAGRPQTNLDLNYWYTGRLKNNPMTIEHIRSYQLSRKNSSTIRAHLIECNKIIDRSKKPISSVGKVAVDWLNRHA